MAGWNGGEQLVQYDTADNREHWRVVCYIGGPHNIIEERLEKRRVQGCGPPAVSAPAALLLVCLTCCIQ